MCNIARSPFQQLFAANTTRDRRYTRIRINEPSVHRRATMMTFGSRGWSGPEAGSHVWNGLALPWQRGICPMTRAMPRRTGNPSYQFGPLADFRPEGAESRV